MLFEWSPEKAEANLRKHKIGFDSASRALLGLTVTKSSVRLGETRFMSTCVVDGRKIVVIWTPRQNAVRLISARVARVHERREFDQALREAAETR